MSVTPNGSNKLLYWVIGMLAPAMLGGITSTVHVVLSNSERTAVLESQLHRVEERLQQLDQKLDRILEHSNRRN